MIVKRTKFLIICVAKKFYERSMRVVFSVASLLLCLGMQLYITTFLLLFGTIFAYAKGLAYLCAIENDENQIKKLTFDK